MKQIPMGDLRVASHDAKTISGALDVADDQYDTIVRQVISIYEKESTISRMIEQVVVAFKGSELALALMILGQVRERAKRR